MSAFHQSIMLFGSSTLKEELRVLLNCDSILAAINEDLVTLDPTFNSTYCQPMTFNITDDNSLLAFAYVWAGSSMGAQILIKWLQKNKLCLPMNYYQKMAVQAANWHQVKVLISEQLKDRKIHSESVIDKAIDWFEAIIAHTNEYSPIEPTGQMKQVEAL